MLKLKPKPKTKSKLKSTTAPFNPVVAKKPEPKEPVDDDNGKLEPEVAASVKPGPADIVQPGLGARAPPPSKWMTLNDTAKVSPGHPDIDLSVRERPELRAPEFSEAVGAGRSLLLGRREDRRLDALPRRRCVKPQDQEGGSGVTEASAASISPDDARGEAAARPLPVLAKLIQKDLADAEAAGMEYYRAAGEKLIEAKLQLNYGESGAWVKQNFKISQPTSYRYMAMARHLNNSRANYSESQNEFFRKKKSSGKSGSKKKTIGNEGDEQELRRKLALEIIAIGYKALAKKLHPDNGGPTEEMARLNEVRDRLKSVYGKDLSCPS